MDFCESDAWLHVIFSYKSSIFTVYNPADISLLACVQGACKATHRPRDNCIYISLESKLAKLFPCVVKVM